MPPCTPSSSTSGRAFAVSRANPGSQRRFQLDLAIAFALAAMGLAALGVYGAIVFSVVQRRRGIGERDPLTFVIAAVTLGVVALAASVLPALAAARLDPMTVLRSE